ncbi:hypothetical protein SCE1572_20895 [Sorangium cellulosum So0157-2]|uniref:Uncharacterized protein n=1 Tax=Sorangium cellulosum So0157-2 TaxID=1254432 RepID=S4XW54_SORCE|nr:hypothetical protein SCE1572_20895 [Sorangium cellulosum So0157-2]
MDEVLVPEGLAEREEQRVGAERAGVRQRRGADPGRVRRAPARRLAGALGARLDDDRDARPRPAAPVEVAEQARPRIAFVPGGARLDVRQGELARRAAFGEGRGEGALARVEVRGIAARRRPRDSRRRSRRRGARGRAPSRPRERPTRRSRERAA